MVFDSQNARAAYLEHQNKVRRDMEAKRLEKESGKVMDMFWNAPPECMPYIYSTNCLSLTSLLDS